VPESDGPLEEPVAGRDTSEALPAESAAGSEDDLAPRDPGRRPTPARVVMEGAAHGTVGLGSQRRAFRDPANGQEWVLEVTGRSTSGVLPLRLIHLMDVSFALADNPEVPLRRALCPEGSLEDLDDEEIMRLFRRSRPHRSPDPRTREGEAREVRRRARPDPQE
jgi:hypothetical protein